MIWCVSLLSVCLSVLFLGLHGGQEIMWIRSSWILLLLCLTIYICFSVIITVNAVIFCCWSVLYLWSVCPEEGSSSVALPELSNSSIQLKGFFLIWSKDRGIVKPLEANCDLWYWVIEIKLTRHPKKFGLVQVCLWADGHTVPSSARPIKVLLNPTGHWEYLSLNFHSSCRLQFYSDVSFIWFNLTHVGIWDGQR